MKKRVSLIIVFCFYLVLSFAQSMTYNHDNSKMNQFTVGEISAGSLTPELYYKTFHNSYLKDAETTGKLVFRTATGIDTYKQIEFSDSIKNDLKERAEVEALNLADRTIDLSWETWHDKLEKARAKYDALTLRLLNKTTAEEITAWEDLGKQMDYAIEIIHTAYMPNSKREESYQLIYKNMDIWLNNLCKRVNYLNMQEKFEAFDNAQGYNRRNVVAGAAAGAYTRWRESVPSKPKN